MRVLPYMSYMGWFFSAVLVINRYRFGHFGLLKMEYAFFLSSRVLDMFFRGSYSFLTVLNLVPRASFPLISGRKTRALGASSGSIHFQISAYPLLLRTCAQRAARSLHVWYLWRMPEMDAPSSRFPTAGQGERSSGNEIALPSLSIRPHTQRPIMCSATGLSSATVINGVSIFGLLQILAINWVRVLESGPHSPSKFFWEYPTGLHPLHQVSDHSTREEQERRERVASLCFLVM